MAFVGQARSTMCIRKPRRGLRVTVLGRVTLPPLDPSLGRGGGTLSIMMTARERNFSSLKDLPLEELILKENYLSLKASPKVTS